MSTLTGALGRHSAGVRAVAKAAIAALRARLPGATEFVYIKKNSLVIGFGPTDRPSEAPVSLAVYTRWVNLYFLEGAHLPDPAGLLHGSGTSVRHIRLDDERAIERPEVQALLAAAIAESGIPFDESRRRRTVIRQNTAASR